MSNTKSTNLSIGIVGLPNVGKSTLFNALLKKQVAFAANYPFATIEPNTGIVEVPDPRIEGLSELVRKEDKKDPDKIIPAVVKFVDIAGLVKGAAQGEGLGNKFLSHIREVDAIIHLIRVFEDENVARAGSTTPQNDKEVINTELILSDLEVLEKRIPVELRNVRSGDKDAAVKCGAYKKLQNHLNSGKLASTLELSEREKEAVKDLNLLTSKPVLYVFNISEDAFIEEEKLELSKEFDGIPICAKLESELAGLSEEERREYMAEMGVGESGLDKIIKKSYEILGLQTFFTYGPKEVCAWTIKKGFKAPQAAGKIHTDFERGFIAAQIVSYEVLVKLEGWKNAREKGLVRSEGKDYTMQEGDVVEFRFSV